ncbi:MAG: head GIN domain-containing protein [Bacteroidota bacterium]
MKNLVSLLLLVGLVFAQTACEYPQQAFPCEDGVGERVTEVREFESFSKIMINLPGDVYLHQANEYRVEVTAQDNILEFLTTEVAENQLTITNSNCLNDFKTIRMDVYLPSLEMLEIQGSGDVYSEEAFDNASDQLLINIKGSGGVELDANAKTVAIDIMGSGDVTLKTQAEIMTSTIEGSGDILLRGNVDKHSLQIDGTGNARAFELMSRETAITITGEGDCEISAEEKLIVDIRGSGNVYYKGNPVLDATVTGTGQIIFVE